MRSVQGALPALTFQLSQPAPLLKRARPIDYSRFDHIGSSSESESSPPCSRPPSRPAVFEVPEGARIDLDARSYVEREMLRDPAFRREVPKKLRKEIEANQDMIGRSIGLQKGASFFSINGMPVDLTSQWGDPFQPA